MTEPMRALPGPEPTGPELLPIQALHRHDDGIVTFHRKNTAGEFENLFGIRSEHLAGMFPQFREQLEADAFFSLNAYWNRESGRHYISAAQARQSDRLRYLCACYVDLDCYKSAIPFGAALATIINYQDEGRIPPASVIVRSGRGLWLLWLLHDPQEPAMPPRAFPEKIRLHAEINRAANARLANLGADAAASDVMRLIRVPGSMHGTVNGSKFPRVKYWIQSANGREAQSYTLPELADAFGVQPRKLDKATERAFSECNRPTGSRLRGHQQLNARRLREFEVLRAMRGSFSEGCRNHAAVLYAWLLGRSGLTREATFRQIETLGRECNPPLDLAACRAAAKTAFSRKISRVRDQTIADWLEITPAESDLLEKLPPAARFRVSNSAPIIAPPINAEQRRSLIQQIVARVAGVPTCRRMADLLAAEGHSVSHVQVSRDYLALGLASRPKPHQARQDGLFCRMLQPEHAVSTEVA